MYYFYDEESSKTSPAVSFNVNLPSSNLKSLDGKFKFAFDFPFIDLLNVY